ncbi:Uncharacterised protein [Niallia circulans]|uniref:hypothetical protein n=1 Tax=Shouchella clausii TaxID=79880 RepID=UPI000D87FA79|nr:hypothetical protein [Shouchella clausii]MCM3550589.1 hypothetical protein [Shouchella clausii]SPU21937.1 Uncharacterised protein [Niallia circulans]
MEKQEKEASKSWKEQRNRDQVEQPFDELPLEDIEKEEEERREKKRTKDDSESEDAYKP